MKRHLAQLNIATLRHPMDDPRTADFANALPAVNGAGEQSPGYLWRLQSDAGDATDIQVFDDPLIIVNLTVWESLDALKAFAYRGIHRDFFRRRAEWFVDGSTRTALWWMPAGVLPTTDDAKRRLDFIEVFGSSPYAFTMGQTQPALAIERVGPDDHRVQELGARVDGGGAAEETATVVVAEIDDVPVACGGYRIVDDTTAEIKRMYVARSARGLRVGAAIVAELEAAARSERMQRLLLETWPRQLDALAQFGFRHCPAWSEPTLSPDSVFMEKSLAN
ncbi:MAG TPA: GNAT family N-acetyltransferase [Ilumatobacteraceae bacterium]|nr:GNAT family N-acetyltransferase [Ilumatobacteraceae bacterium]